MKSWELCDVCYWLQSLKLDQYAAIFVGHKITGSKLINLTGTRGLEIFYLP